MSTLKRTFRQNLNYIAGIVYWQIRRINLIAFSFIIFAGAIAASVTVHANAVNVEPDKEYLLRIFPFILGDSKEAFLKNTLCRASILASFLKFLWYTDINGGYLFMINSRVNGRIKRQLKSPVSLPVSIFSHMLSMTLINLGEIAGILGLLALGPFFPRLLATKLIKYASFLTPWLTRNIVKEILISWKLFSQELFIHWTLISGGLLALSLSEMVRLIYMVAILWFQEISIQVPMQSLLIVKKEAETFFKFKYKEILLPLSLFLVLLIKISIGAETFTLHPMVFSIFYSGLAIWFISASLKRNKIVIGS